MTAKKPARDSQGRYIKSTTTTTVTTTTTTSKVIKKKPVVKAAPAFKNYIGISRDHSGSMGHIAGAAARDYNSNIASLLEASIAEKQDTIVSVVKCGVGHRGIVVREVVNSTVSKLQSLNERDYTTDGAYTPLFDSVNELISILQAVPDANDPNVSFVVMAITDGFDNHSRLSGYELGRKIQQLQATDHWTFVFRVPRGNKQALVNLGISAGNILEWDLTTRGVEVASAATNVAIRSFMSSRSKGMTSTNDFYTTDLSQVSKATVKAKLVDISSQVEFFGVRSPEMIRPFVESQIHGTMNKGGAFYQLTKKEDEVQDYKQIAIRDKKSGSVHSGLEARNILGLPFNGTVKIAPGNHGQYDIFIQSTSVNRKLVPGTQVMYWSKVGTTFQS
jgi:NADPH-dependent 7-cyano-7-deazaguanine reductase QueF-like protein